MPNSKLLATVTSLMLLSGAADAQDDDLLDLTRQLLEQDAANETAAEAITQSLTRCLPPVSTQAPETEPIRFEVAIGPGGMPARPAEILDPTPDKAELIHIQQLLRAEAAVIDCAPLEVEGTPARNTKLILRATETELEIIDVAALDIPLSEPATAEDEAFLDLNRENRREIQIRLRLAGFDPGGADGIFGPRTRNAVSGFQIAQEWPVTGYLNATQVETLVNNTQAAYITHLEQRAQAQPKPTTTTRRKTRTRVYRGSDGCLRYANGRIVPKQNFRCDAKGLIQSF